MNSATVPVEPTEEMLDAACNVGPDTNNGAFSHDDARAVFTAMLSAAPAPEGGEVRAWMFRESQSERWHVTMDRRSVEEYLKAFSTAEIHPLAIATREESPAEAGEPKYFAAFMGESEALRAQPPAREEASVCARCSGKGRIKYEMREESQGFPWDPDEELFPDCAQPPAREDAQPVAVCDGVEQPAFEEWAAKQGFDMHEHPLHYLFLDAKTDAARQAWKAGLEHAVGRMATHPAPDALRVAVEKVRDQYKDQMRFCDIEPLPYFREFVRRIDAALQAEQGAK